MRTATLITMLMLTACSGSVSPTAIEDAAPTPAADTAKGTLPDPVKDAGVTAMKEAAVPADAPRLNPYDGGGWACQFEPPQGQNNQAMCTCEAMRLGVPDAEPRGCTAVAGAFESCCLVSYDEDLAQCFCIYADNALGICIGMLNSDSKRSAVAQCPPP